MSGIQKAVDASGGTSKLAAKLGVSQPVVSNWKKRGVPANRVLAVEAATDGKVTRHELRPDLYPQEVVQS
jgi:DNA-binding transcriptional regulator YdaS (Cro superfamily)